MITPWRRGLDFEVMLLHADDRKYVLRLPLQEVTETEYEGTTHYAEVVEREAALYPLLREAGVPVPRLLGWGRGKRTWMLADLVEHDEVKELNEAQQHALGVAVRRMHQCAPALEGPGGQGDPDFLHERAVRRYRYATRHVDLPPVEVVAPLLRGPDEPRVVLHMDLRPDNLCFRGDELVGVLDLSNALVAPRHVELGRLHGFGGLTAAFLRGYGAHDVDRRQMLVHSVDAFGLMIALAVEELHDQEMLADTGKRLQETIEELRA